MRRRLAIKLRIYALTFSYVNFLSGPMSVVLILNTSFFFRSNASSVLHINRNELKQSILHFCQFFSYMHLCTLFCFYKNVVFPAQVEYSYFSAIFRLDFILVLFPNQACDISVLECVMAYHDQLQLLQDFSFCWLFFPFRERNNFIWRS